MTELEREEMLNCISQFINNIHRYRFTDFQINKLYQFINRRYDFDGKMRYRKGFEHKSYDHTYDRSDDRTDYIYKYVFDGSSVFILSKAVYFRDGRKIDEDPQEKVIQNARELLDIAEWFLRPNIPDYNPD